MVEKDRKSIIKNFTNASIEILEADFGWAWWKFKENQEYKLAYKTPNTPYTPTAPRKNAGNQIAFKTKKPFFDSNIKKENYQFDILRYLKSYIIIPIFYRNYIYGNLVLCYKKQHDFNLDELTLAEAIGNAAAQAKTIRRLIGNEQKARILSEKQKTHFQALIENSYEIIVHLDSRGKILYVSPSVKKILGVAAKNLIGKNLSVFAKNTGALKTSNYIKKIINNPNKRHVEEFQHKTKKGDILFFESISSKMPDTSEDGGIVVNIRDITEHKKLREAEKAEKQLAEEKLKVESIADATHELRTPLAIIKGNVDLAKRSGKHLKSFKSIIKDIDEETRHLSNIISDLALITSQKNNGQNEITTSKVSLRAIIKDVAGRFTTLAQHKNISITINFGEDIVMRGNKVYLEKMLINLIKNSINYGKQNGYTSIAAKKSGKFITLTVSDNGIGITKGDLPHVFARFYRGDKSHSSVQGEGTGLGLSIVKWVAEIHKGSVSVKSEQNKGSIFSVILPVGRLRA